MTGIGTRKYVPKATHGLRNTCASYSRCFWRSVVFSSNFWHENWHSGYNTVYTDFVFLRFLFPVKSLYGSNGQTLADGRTVRTVMRPVRTVAKCSTMLGDWNRVAVYDVCVNRDHAGRYHFDQQKNTTAENLLTVCFASTARLDRSIELPYSNTFCNAPTRVGYSLRSRERAAVSVKKTPYRPM